MRARFNCHQGSAGRQRGIVLLVVMVVMVVMALAGIALFRSVDSNVLVAGNLAFTQSVALGSDRAVDAGVAVVASASEANLATGAGLPGYVANNLNRIDFTASDPDVADFDWSNAGPSFALPPDAVTGDRSRFVIHRLCATTMIAKDDNSQCVKGELRTGSGVTSGGVEGGSKGLASGTTPDSRDAQVYYRITTRTDGARSAVTYSQAIVK